jgi:heptose-I-phosphate ethanolaminephosphotransferase
MNLMRQAGYKSYWITNQQTMTKRNTMLTTFSKQTDKQFYLNHSRAQNSRMYDGVVLEPFQQILQDAEPRKFIVVHLLGTHAKYQYRFPDEYERFSGREGIPATLSDDQVEVVNDYDNAVLYNDFVVASLIESLSAAGQNSLLVYFSDHGEDVFDSPGHKIFGRSEGRPTLPMYTIPFFVWLSEQWRDGQPRVYPSKVLNRPYSTSHFIHTWADLAGLRFDDFDPGKSLINKDFKETPLWVGSPYLPKSMIDLRLQMRQAEGR